MGEMVKDPNCAYCVEGELLAKFGYPCCEMKTGKLYVFKEQSKRGRVILAHKKHVSELIELTDEERNDYFADVAKVARAIHKVFNPDKVNYGAYGWNAAWMAFAARVTSAKNAFLSSSLMFTISLT